MNVYDCIQQYKEIIYARFSTYTHSPTHILHMKTVDINKIFVITGSAEGTADRKVTQLGTFGIESLHRRRQRQV